MAPSNTVISDPPETRNGYEAELIERVREYGWRTTSVHAGDDGSPAFSYTTGFWLTGGSRKSLCSIFRRSWLTPSLVK
jgi:hypothetical protein